MVKKLFTWLAIGFAVYYVLVFPEDAARVVRSAAAALAPPRNG